MRPSLLARGRPKPVPSLKSVTVPCGAGQKTVRYTPISTPSRRARNQPTSRAQLNVQPCWKRVIRRSLPAFRQARSCRNWLIKGDIWPRNPASIASCSPMGSSITGGEQGRQSGAKHPQTTRPVRPARSGLGTSHGYLGRWQACSSTSISS